MISKRRKVATILLGVAVIAATAAYFTREREPSYQGKPLSKLIDLADPYFGACDRQEKDSAIAGVRAIGTNAIPFLIRWIQHEEPASVTRLRDSLKRVTGKPIISEHKLYLANNAAIHAFATLGPAADAAIPELTKLMAQSNRQEVADRAALALCLSARPGALPALINALTNQSNPCRHTIAESIHCFGTNALPAVPALIERLEDEDELVAKSAASSLGELRLQPDIVIPALVRCARTNRPIVSDFAFGALREYGTNASAAIPLLARNLQNPNLTLRQSATNALQRIAPELLTNAPPQ